MKITLVRHLWGVDHTHGLEHYLARWSDVGYEALEGSLHLSPDREALLRFLKTSDWKWIPQVFSHCYPTRRHRSPTWQTSATGWPAAKNHASNNNYQ